MKGIRRMWNYVINIDAILSAMLLYPCRQILAFMFSLRIILKRINVYLLFSDLRNVLPWILSKDIAKNIRQLTTVYSDLWYLIQLESKYREIHPFIHSVIPYCTQLHIGGLLGGWISGLKWDLYQFCGYKNTRGYRWYIYKCMFSWFHLSVLEHLLKVRYCGKHDWKYSNKLDKILYLFVICNHLLSVLRRVELALENAPWSGQYLNWTLEALVAFPWWGCVEEETENFLRNGSEVESGRECLRMTIWQGTVWEQNAGMSQEEQLQEINQGPDRSRLASNTGARELGSYPLGYHLCFLRKA